MERIRALLVGRRLLIAGYGREGQSSERLLRELCPESPLTVAHDDRELSSLLATGGGYDWIVKSPGIPLSKIPPQVDPSRITSQTDLFLQVYADRTVGVTGTKGKSTTTALIGHMLRCGLPGPVVVAGNMGVPLFDILPQMTSDTTVVAELSCHQLQGIRRAPHTGVLLNLYQDHLDHYRDYRDYQMAKLQIMLRQQPGDVCYYCADSSDLAHIVAEQRSRMPGQVVAYSLAEAEADVSWHWSTALAGSHNRSNIFVARQVASRLGVGAEICERALATFEGLPHRLQRVGTRKGITFYNDSISTIPEATVAALQALPDTETLILGGYDRGIDYTPLVEHLTRQDSSTKVRNLVFVGAAGRRIARMLAGRGSWQTLCCDDYARIVAWCYEHTTPGHICLLSPAAASYDSFKNFEERGETFCRLAMGNS